VINWLQFDPAEKPSKTVNTRKEKSLMSHSPLLINFPLTRIGEVRHVVVSSPIVLYSPMYRAVGSELLP
jgi:hypothetical protein